MSRRLARWVGRGLRRARSRFIQGSAILGYHRVADGDDDPFRLAVTPEHFAEQLEVVRGMANPVTINALAQAIRDREVPRGTFAVTFDDGYADNLHVAKPILARLDIPATVYVVAGRLGRHFWWDELAAHVPDRRQLLRTHRRLLRLPHEARRRLIEEILAAPRDGDPKPIVRVVTADELVELARDGFVSIGAHSLTHPLLSALRADEQSREIRQSKKQLQELLGRTVDTFAYPWGAASQETQRLVCEAGFRSASGMRIDVVSRSSDPYDLPRLWVPDVDGERFARWLRGWLNS